MGTKVSDFRREKYGFFFDFLDLDGDGYVTKDDLKENVSNIQRNLQLSDRTKMACQREMVSWWAVFEDEANKNGGRLSKEGFLKSQIEYYESADTTPEVDQNGDGVISFEEFKAYYRAHSCTDDKKIRKIFDTLDTNKDGVLSMDEFVHANTQYFLSDDPQNGYEFLYKNLKKT